MLKFLKWSHFKDHDINCTSLNAGGCANEKLSYEFNYDASYTPVSVAFACSCCSLTTTLPYSTASSGFLSLTTRVGLTEPIKIVVASTKYFGVRRY